jgi:hypothetical protein
MGVFSLIVVFSGITTHESDLFWDRCSSPGEYPLRSLGADHCDAGDS